MNKEVENLKLAAGASKAPIGIVPMHPLYGCARVLEDSECKYGPFNYMLQPVADAVAAYDNAFLRHRIACSKIGGQVTPESYAALDEDSGLPHIFHMIDGLLILATLMIRDGMLPLDPGQGKRKQAKIGLRWCHTPEGPKLITDEERRALEDVPLVCPFCSGTDHAAAAPGHWQCASTISRREVAKLDKEIDAGFANKPQTVSVADEANNNPDYNPVPGARW